MRRNSKWAHKSSHRRVSLARRFDVDASGPNPSATIIIASDLETLRDILSYELYLVCIARAPEDDPKIVETWL